MKAASRTLGISINDLATCALSNTLKKYFEKQGDKTPEINIVIPANIRWAMYKRPEDVKLENKFAPIPISLPLIGDKAATLKRIKQVTGQVRSAFA